MLIPSATRVAKIPTVNLLVRHEITIASTYHSYVCNSNISIIFVYYQELRFLPFHFLSYKTPKPNTKSTNTLFNSNYKFSGYSQFCSSNFTKSKSQTKFPDLKLWETTFPRAQI
jgi:hypothetical protein